MEIRRYKAELKSEWDGFVKGSKNGTFLLCRDFMEYHVHRFSDYSLMFYQEGNLVGLIPAHMVDDTFCSHMGLTYGGLILSDEISAKGVLDIFDHLRIFLCEAGLQKFIYKAIPHIYHRMPSEEDLYALFRQGAKLIGRNISSTILLSEKVKYSDSRLNGLKKAEKAGLKVLPSNDYSKFWEILDSNLKLRYGTKPVHSLDEITVLSDKFPENIHLLSVSDDLGEMLGGCVLFETDTVVHAQYTAATENGKKIGAIDVLIDHIIHREYSNKIYFDYGISSENGGLYLNESLIYQKEGFGARATLYDTYEIDLNEKMD